MGKTLIAYFSKAGENNVNGDIINLPKGNTEIAAEYIKEFIPDADMFKIDPVEPMPESYEDCFAKAKVDQSANMRPEIKNCPESIDDSLFNLFNFFSSSFISAFIYFFCSLISLSIYMVLKNSGIILMP